MSLSGRQIVAARALLGITQEDLAEQACLSMQALQEIETTAQGIDGRESDLQSLRLALERAGITFIDERATSSAGGAGIRLSAPQSTSIDADATETVQYPEMARNGPFGAGG